MTRLMTAIMLALLTFSGCRTEEKLKPLPDGRADDAATSVNEFAVDLYRQLALEDGNLFFSPASISTALTMTWIGAGGQTALEATSVLHLNSGREQVLADYSHLLGGLAGTDSTYTLNVANRLWGQKDFSFKESYLERIQSCFGGGLQPVDFKSHPNEERLVINQWVAKRTQDKIQNLLPAGTVTQDTRLVLTNAVYFLGDWLFPFPENRTKDVDFHLADGSKKSIPTMKLKKNLPYFSDDSLAMVALPYVGNDLQFMVILPHLKNGLPKIEAGLNSTSLAKNIQAMSSKKVDVWLPRLDLAQDFNLGDTLKKLGMKQAFSPGQADFSGMTDQTELFISSVVHKSFLKVDEQGTEAAAATGVTIGVTSMPSPPTMFVADHPFLFLIRQKDTGVILFMGRYENPLM